MPTRAPARRKPAKVEPFPLSYAEFLDAQLDDPAKRKGERTKDRLKAATVRLLGEVGYRDLRVTDINARAGVSNALFYVYFQNKEVISLEVMTDYLVYLETFRARAPIATSIEQSIYYGNLRYAEMFKANAGLMRCLFQLTDEFPPFAKIWHSWNERWCDRVLRSLERANDLKFKNADEVAFTVQALGSMVDASLRLAFVDKERGFGVPTVTADLETFALLMTRLWVRALFTRDLKWTPPSS